MKPWIIEQVKRERREREWKPVPLHIQEPPPEWIREQEREAEKAPAPDKPERGVWIIDL